MWENKAALPPGIEDGVVDMPDGETAGVVEGPSGVFMLDKGGLSIKRTNAFNLWGALGDVNLILGRYSLSGGKTAEAAERTASEASPE